MSATTDMLASISTPDTVEIDSERLSSTTARRRAATAALLYDHLDFLHGVEAFLDALPGASLNAIRRGFLSVGVEDNDVLIFPELMDSASLFLTPTATRSTSGGSSISRTGRWCSTCQRSTRRQGSSGRSTTCGSAG